MRERDERSVQDLSIFTVCDFGLLAAYANGLISTLKMNLFVSRVVRRTLTHSLVHYLFQPICICATDRMQICLYTNEYGWIEAQMNSMPYVYYIKWAVEIRLLTQRRNKKGIEKSAGSSCCSLISMICIHFALSHHSYTHFWNVIFSRFCAFHSVYWPIKMLGNKFACFFFLRCINSIEDFTRFVSEWKTIYSHVTRNLRPTTQSIIPNINSGPPHISILVCVAYTNGNNLFLQSHGHAHSFGCCLGGLWVYEMKCMFFRATALSSTKCSILFLSHVNYFSFRIYFIFMHSPHQQFEELSAFPP